jgi:hypothetical protein
MNVDRSTIRQAALHVRAGFAVNLLRFLFRNAATLGGPPYKKNQWLRPAFPCGRSKIGLLAAVNGSLMPVACQNGRELPGRYNSPPEPATRVFGV